MSADGSRVGPMERDIELAITALKKGACLLKYGRRGKPKFCPFRLANDESVLVWLSGNEEKHLKLSHVSRIIPGQRTTIFQRHPRPDKEYQSFSLIYGDRSLDLICKDKDEAEVWFTGLKALISQCHNRKGRAESRIDGFSSEANSPHTYTQKSSPLSSAFGNGDSLQKESVEASIRTPFESSPQSNFRKVVPDVLFYAMPQKVFQPSESICGSVHSLSSGGSDGINSRTKGMGVDAIRVSLSSAVSSSSHGSGHADGDALGDVFIWGEGTGDGILGGGIHRMGSSFGFKMDSLFPRSLESAVVLDVQNIACGGQHAALVTKQGEVFTWGEELGGRLGHGVDSDVSHPKLIDALTNTNIELVACGEHHTCAVTLSGDLYTWGNTYNFGLLGHGNEVSHWVPKRLNGPLEGIHVSSISCGPWHTAVVTSAGQLFTFGDGTFGVLGHGDRESVPIPREVESLRGLRTVRAACGVWHTAAVVEVMVGSSNSSHCSSGKLFTWGDGDKGRLGHGDKEPRLVPTCVAIVEPNFCQVVCGHSLTVALTTSGQVYTMGSPVYGQLGHPQTDEKIPVRVEKLTKCFVEEIACGAYHVAVLTSRTEVYTWGKGANGRLGHGDADDRSFPAVVEALKDKQVKSIACGTNFTAAICLHKWVSGVDQSMCSGCHLPFNFKRKRHNCYNCGLVFCHSCSSKKSLRASMAPNPRKLYRVCDNCFSKLQKTTELDSSYHSTLNRRGSINQGLSEVVGKDDKMNSRTQMHPGKYTLIEGFKDSQSGLSWRNRKLEFNSSRVSPLPTTVSQGAALTSTRSFNPASGSSKKFFSVSLPGSRTVSRATSPTSKRSSPPRSMTPTPTLVGLASQKSSAGNSRTNDTLSQEVHRLKAEVETLMRKTHLQEVEMERTNAQLREAIAVAGEESAKCKTAKEVIKLLTSQLKEVAERLPVGAARYCNSPSLGPCGPNLPADVSVAALEKLNSLTTCHIPNSNGSNSMVLSKNLSTSDNNSSIQTGVGHLEAVGRNKNKTTEDETIHMADWVEQDEPGVYITLGSLPGGVRDLKRVRFSRKRFSEKQAEQWWAANKAKVYQRYNVPMGDKSTVGIGKEGLAL